MSKRDSEGWQSSVLFGRLFYFIDVEVQVFKCVHRGGIPWLSFKIWTPFWTDGKIFNFPTRDPNYLHACASLAYDAIFYKNRFFATAHGDKAINQNGFPLRSPFPIMYPDETSWCSSSPPVSCSVVRGSNRGAEAKGFHFRLRHSRDDVISFTHMPPPLRPSPWISKQ